MILPARQLLTMSMAMTLLHTPLILNIKHALQLLTRNQILLPRPGALPQRIRRFIPTVRDPRDTVVMHAFAEVFLQAVAELFALGEQHVPFAAEEDDVVREGFEHAGGRDAGAEPGVREVEGRGLQVRVVEELSEDGGELLVRACAGCSALGSGLCVVGGRVEGDDAPDFEDCVGGFGHDGDGGAVFVGGDEGEGGGAGLAEHGDAVDAGFVADQGDAGVVGVEELVRGGERLDDGVGDVAGSIVHDGLA